MTILITKDYGVSLPNGNLLGIVGEHNLRTAKVVHPVFDKARYIMKFLYQDGVCYEKEITDGVLTLDGSLLRIPGEVKMQFFAYAENEEKSKEIFESPVFTAKIENCIGNKPDAIPSYEQTKDILDQLLDAFSSVINRPVGYKYSLLQGTSARIISGKINQNGGI